MKSCKTWVVAMICLIPALSAAQAKEKSVVFEKSVDLGNLWAYGKSSAAEQGIPAALDKRYVIRSEYRFPDAFETAFTSRHQEGVACSQEYDPCSPYNEDIESVSYSSPQARATFILLDAATRTELARAEYGLKLSAVNRIDLLSGQPARHLGEGAPQAVAFTMDGVSHDNSVSWIRLPLGQGYSLLLEQLASQELIPLQATVTFRASTPGHLEVGSFELNGELLRSPRPTTVRMDGHFRKWQGYALVGSTGLAVGQSEPDRLVEER